VRAAPPRQPALVPSARQLKRRAAPGLVPPQRLSGFARSKQIQLPLEILSQALSPSPRTGRPLAIVLALLGPSAVLVYDPLPALKGGVSIAGVSTVTPSTGVNGFTPLPGLVKTVGYRPTGSSKTEPPFGGTNPGTSQPARLGFINLSSP
jgi:hypothetical protein